MPGDWSGRRVGTRCPSRTQENNEYVESTGLSAVKNVRESAARASRELPLFSLRPP